MHEFGQYELKIPIRGWKSSEQASAGIIRKLLEGFACLLSHTTNNILLIFKSYPLDISPLNFYFYTKIPAFMTMKIEVLFGIVRIYCFFFFFIYVGCPGQLRRTTTIPHGPLDILQAQEQVRHRGGDRRAHRGSNPGRGRNKSHGWPQQLDPQVQFIVLLTCCVMVH